MSTSGPEGADVYYISGVGLAYPFGGGYIPVVLSAPAVALAVTVTVIPDASVTNTFDFVVSGALTIHGPANPVDGQRIVLRILNDASHTVTLATGPRDFRFGTDTTSYVNSVSLTDYVGAIYNGPASRWDVVSVVHGY